MCVCVRNVRIWTKDYMCVLITGTNSPLDSNASGGKPDVNAFKHPMNTLADSSCVHEEQGE